MEKQCKGFVVCSSSSQHFRRIRRQEAKRNNVYDDKSQQVRTLNKGSVHFPTEVNQGSVQC